LVFYVGFVLFLLIVSRRSIYLFVYVTRERCYSSQIIAECSLSSTDLERDFDLIKDKKAIAYQTTNYNEFLLLALHSPTRD